MNTNTTSLKDLLVQDLAKLYYAENQLVRALGMMAAAATDAQLGEAFLEHRIQTKAHAERLARLFPALHALPQAHFCTAIEGLLENGKWLIHTMDRGLALDIALVGAAHKVELFEMAGYRNLCGLAQHLGLTNVLSTAQEILLEEYVADTKLTDIAANMGLESGVILSLEETGNAQMRDGNGTGEHTASPRTQAAAS